MPRAKTKTADKLKTRTRTKKIAEAYSVPQTEKSSMAFRIKKSYLVIFLTIIILAGIAYYYKSLFIVATVNGQPITRLAMIQELEKQGGKQTLNSLVTKTLILQEANNKNITVTPSEIDQEIKKINENLKKQGQNLDQILLTRGMSQKEFREQIQTQKLIDKMITKDITVTKKEIDDYIDKNKDSFPESMKPNEIENRVKEQLRQQKLNDKFQSWLDSLQKKAKINYFINY